MRNPYWVDACTSITGSSHVVRGTPCQDASAIVRLGKAGEIVILALSDGAGSSSHSDLGAQIVVRQWLNHFTTLLSEYHAPAAILEECGIDTIHSILEAIRETVEAEAVAFEVEPSDFSATLLGAVLTPSFTLVAQVGDGCWVGSINGILGCLTWPTGGEFAGQTVFATSESARSALQIVHLLTPPSALAGFTDGMERLLLDFRTQVPAEGFFSPVFHALKASPQNFAGQLEEYLQSENVCERTDDDKSLGIVLNPNADF
jgi:Protein phosphatase 2C